MGKNTITVTIQSTGQSKSYTINVLDIEFVEGYWTTDKEGKNPLEKAKLGETVYFHVDIKGLTDGKEIQLSLAEYDYNHSAAFLFPGAGPLLKDVIDPDDRKFPEKEVVKKAIVKDSKATIELVLEESWEGMIKDDHDEWFSTNESLELYWEISYNNKYKTELPKSDDNYLLVGQNDKTLYIKPFEYGYNMPEFFDYEGNPLAYMQISTNNAIDPQVKKDIENEHAEEILLNGVSILKDEIVDKSFDKIAKYSEQKIRQIALARFDKASLAIQNTPYSPNLLNDFYTHDPLILEQLKNKKVWDKVIKGNGVKSLQYYGKTGTKMQVLGFLKQLDNIGGPAIEFFDLIKFGASDGLDLSNPLSFPGIGLLGPVGAAFSLVNGVAGMLVKQLKDEQDAWLAEDIQQEVNEAKLNGLEATRQAINSWHHDLNTWQLLSISNKTANTLLQGEFNTFDELIEHNDINQDFDDNTIILYREVESSNKERIIYVIESIFINAYE